jgi:hypothetical protein
VSKYGAVRTVVDGLTFASKKEARRYSELRLLERAGEIGALTLQPRYPLKVNGKLVCTYVADFEYYPADPQKSKVVEDAKGVRTPAYVIKAKLFEALYGFKISEV